MILFNLCFTTFTSYRKSTKTYPQNPLYNETLWHFCCFGKRLECCVWCMANDSWIGCDVLILHYLQTSHGSASVPSSSPAHPVLVLQEHVLLEQHLLQPGGPHEPARGLLLPFGRCPWRSVARQCVECETNNTQCSNLNDTEGTGVW